MNNIGKCTTCGKTTPLENIHYHLSECCLSNFADTKDELFVLGINIDKFIREDDYTVIKNKNMWLTMLAPRDMKFNNLDKLIRTKWFKCCSDSHICEYILPSKKVITSNKQNKSQISSSRTKLSDGFKKIDSSVKYEFDSVLTSHFKITLLDRIKPCVNGSKIYKPTILAQNCENFKCDKCSKYSNESKYCDKCKLIMCKKCTNKHKCDGEIIDLTNDPRFGVICSDLSRYIMGKLATDVFHCMIIKLFI